MHFFIQYAWENPRFFFSWMLFVVFSICLHEFMHAFAALKQGDDTAARLGHLTLNPLKQMGIFSLVMLATIGICWGAVPVDRRNLRNKYSSALVALAGPLTNLGLFLIFGTVAGLVVKLLQADAESDKIAFLFTMFFQGAMLNMVLFIFNMLPVPGLDGFNVMENILPKNFKQSEFFKGTAVVVLVLAFYFSDKLFRLGQKCAVFLTEFVSGV